MRTFARSVCLLLILTAPALAQEKAGLYKPGDGPLEVAAAEDLLLEDKEQGKELPLRVTYPKEAGKYPVIVFSHGALGSKDNYQPLIRYWCSHGYVCIQPTHGDSLSLMGEEERKGITSVKAHLNSFALLRHWLTRPKDVRFVLDSLDTIEERVPALKGKLDRERIGMGGHSFGAHTTGMISGMSYSRRLQAGRVNYGDERPRAFLMISPPPPGIVADDKTFEAMTRPSLVITGTKDDSPASDMKYEDRLKVFEKLPPKDKYLVVIEDAYHGFGGIATSRPFPSSGPPNEDHVRYVKTVGLAFWDAYLKGDAEAKEYLASDRMEKASDGAVELSSR